MNSITFSQNVLFTHELQANNIIEGYCDDIELITSAIHNKLDIQDSEKKEEY